MSDHTDFITELTNLMLERSTATSSTIKAFSPVVIDGTSKSRDDLVLNYSGYLGIYEKILELLEKQVDVESDGELEAHLLMYISLLKQMVTRLRYLGNLLPTMDRDHLFMTQCFMDRQSQREDDFFNLFVSAIVLNDGVNSSTSE